MPDQPAHMWRYWVDDKGLDTAVEEYFADHFANDPVLLDAYARIKGAEIVINTRMAALASQEEDHD